MQRTLLHLIIQLLVAAMVSLGIAQAWVELCPPDCRHCDIVTVASSCCAGMSAGEVAGPVPVKTVHQSDCDRGSYCDAIDSKHDVLPVYRVADTDVASIAPVRVAQVPELPIRHHSLPLKSPPQGRQPVLYTLHCSLLI